MVIVRIYMEWVDKKIKQDYHKGIKTERNHKRWRKRKRRKKSIGG